MDETKNRDMGGLGPGSAVVRPQQEADAVARAVLDATNRRIAYISAV